MKREEVVRGLERFIDDYKRYINHADWQRVYNALALLKEQGTKVKPQFDDDALDRNTYIKVGDLIDCMTELSMPEDAAFHLAGAIEWACGKRAVALPKEQEARVLDEDEVFVTELSTVLYLERRRARETTRIVPAILLDHDTWCYGTLSSYRYAEFVHEGKLIDHRDLATYGVTWRAWSARPTEEQMRETPWEEDRRET